MARLTEKSIEQIVEKRRRASEPDRAASWRMSSLIQTFHQPIKHRAEILRYFPIAVVATIDGFFRARLANLIDSGEPFVSNAVTKYPDIRLTLQFAEALTNRKVSLGELMMETISISNFKSLIQVLGNITGRPDCLKEIAEATSQALGNEGNKPFISDAADTWSRLDKVFETRHILCHELAVDVVLEESEMRLLLLASQNFIRASARWLEQLEEPNILDKIRKRKEERKRRFTNTQKTLETMFNDIEQLLHDNSSTNAMELRETTNEARLILIRYQEALQKIAAYDPFGLPNSKLDAPTDDFRFLQPMEEKLHILLMHLQSEARHRGKRDAAVLEARKR
jgi:hypothetical protein